MAVSATVPANASLFSSADGTSFSTGSWTPASGTRTYILFVSSSATAAPAVPTVSGNGLTWTQIDTVQFDSIAVPTRRMTAWRARGTASAGATTADFGAVSQNGCGIVVVECDGVDGATNEGVVQFANNRANNGTAESVTLAAFGSATNATLAFFTQDTNNSLAAESGYTNLANGTHGTPGTGYMAEFLASSDTSPSATGGNVAWAGIALELKEAATNRGLQLSFAEFEVPTAPRRLQLSFAEFEVPNAPRGLQVSWLEFEVPTAPRRAQLSWAELEVPGTPARLVVSWAELQVPDVDAPAVQQTRKFLNLWLQSVHRR